MALEEVIMKDAMDNAGGEAPTDITPVEGEDPIQEIVMIEDVAVIGQGGIQIGGKDTQEHQRVDVKDNIGVQKDERNRSQKVLIDHHRKKALKNNQEHQKKVILEVSLKVRLKVKNKFKRQEIKTSKV